MPHAIRLFFIRGGIVRDDAFLGNGDSAPLVKGFAFDFSVSFADDALIQHP